MTIATSPVESSPSVCDERQEVCSSQFVAIERAPSSFGQSQENCCSPKEEAKYMDKVHQFKIKPAQVDGGASDYDPTELAEFDAPDDEEETHFSAAQRQIIQNKTQLEVSDKKLNNAEFR